MNKADFWKMVAFGAMGLYTYNKFKENPHSLGQKEEVTNKAHKLIEGLSQQANVHPVLANHAKFYAKNYIEDKMKIRDVTPIGETNGSN